MSPYIKHMTSASSMHEAGHPKQVLWDNPEGWDGEGGGEFRMWGTHEYLWLFMSMYSKDHHNIVK